MTRFEKDLRAVEADPIDGIEILRERKAELDRIWKEGKAARNGFRQQCLAQEYTRLKAQYDQLAEMI